MKYVIGILLFILCISFKLDAQTMDEASIKKLLQGDWQLKDDETFTLTVTNDTLMEVSRGDRPGTDTFVFTVTKTNCSKDALNSSLTGFYLDEVNVNNNKHLCGSIDLINDSRLKLSYGDQLMEFKRPQ